MKFIFFILSFFIGISSYPQQWSIIAGTTIQIIVISKNQNIQKNRTFFKSGKKILLVDEEATRDFYSLFQEDSTSFKTVYENCAQVMTDFVCDSLEMVQLGIQGSGYIVLLEARKIKREKHSTVSWTFVNPYADGRPCDTWFFINGKR